MQDWPVLRVPAVLRGMDNVVDCTLETWQEESMSGRLFTRCRIVGEPPELPDGRYTLEFASRSVRTNKCHGAWELNFLCDREADVQAA